MMRRPTHIWRTLAISAFAALILVAFLFFQKSSTLSHALDKERLEKESLLSEKIHLTREFEELRKEMSLVKEKNRILNLDPEIE